MRVQVRPDVREREPAHLEALGAEQSKVLVRIVHVPVGGDEARHGVEHLGGLARVGHRLVRKVANFDPCCEEALHALFGRLFDVADVVGNFRRGERSWLGTMGGGRGWLRHVGKGIGDGIKG